ncbi:MAG: hypothetical protein LAN84_12905 [Acidobacteriia bacterium]|nr:hypothetical protein [Terriglobia bacterium]
MRRILRVNGAGALLVFLGLISLLAGSAAGQARSTVTIRLVDGLSSGSSQPGDTFTGTLATPLVMNDRVVADRGELVTGQVRQAVSSGRMSKPAVLTLSLKTVQAPSGRLPMQTGDLTIKADSHATRNLLIIGGSAGMGALVGGAAAGGRGALIGAAAGAGAGSGGAYLTGKREIVLPSETLLTFHVNSVTISPKELQNMQRAGQAPPEPQQDARDYPPPSEPYPIEVRRSRDHDDDDDEYEYEGEGEHRHERYHEHYGSEAPAKIYVFFIEDHYANVDVYWPRRVEHLRMRCDDVDELYTPLARHTGFSVEVLRARVHVRGGHDHGKHKGWYKDHGDHDHDHDHD